jgi:hypothetical protein
MTGKRHGHTSRTRNIKGKWKVKKSPTYLSWESMNSRCYQQTHKWYHLYGGRGIEVCERWRRGSPDAFRNFLEDMGERPCREMTLDRKDGNLGYFKGNCRWADKKTQRANQGTGAYIYDVEPVNAVPF